MALANGVKKGVLMLLVGGIVGEVPLTEQDVVDRLGDGAGCACWLGIADARCVAMEVRWALSGGREL